MSDKEGYTLSVVITEKSTGNVATTFRNTTSLSWKSLLHGFADALHGVGFVDVKSRIAVLEGLHGAFNEPEEWTELKDTDYE